MKIKGILISMAMAGLLASGSAMSAQASNNSIQDKQIHDYIISNPDVVVQSLQIYQQKQMEQTQKSFDDIQKDAPKYADKLFRQTNDPVAGNPNGKVTVVEFFDYQCPHCIDMVPVVDGLIKKNPDLKVIYKEFPIRGPMSDFSARAALAAQKQGKYSEFHKALMTSKVEPLTEEVVFELAKSSGLNVDQLKADMKSDAVDQQIKANMALAKDLKLMWTPVFFIAPSNVTTQAGANAVIFIPGGVDEKQLSDAITKAS
jgi:protein-disulfide isomerase